MGALVKYFVGTFFVLFLIATVFMFSFHEVTKKEVMLDFFSDFTSDQFGSEAEKEQLINVFDFTCESLDSIDLNVSNLAISIDCDKYDGTLDSIIASVFDSVYENRYDCEFLNCIDYSPEIFSTRQGNELIYNISIMFLVATVILGAIMFFQTENPIKSIGFSVFSLVLVYATFLFIPDDISVGNLVVNTSSLMDVFEYNFMIVSFVGLILVIIGYGYEYLYLKKKSKRSRAS